MPKKVVISGYIEGIGLGIYNFFKQNDYHVTGFDLQNGEDLNIQEIYDKFLDECESADIIILNAWTLNQNLMLKDLFKKYKDMHKLCISISSMVSEYAYQELSEKDKQIITIDYWRSKLDLTRLSLKLHKQNKPFKTTVIKPFWVDTNFVKEHEVEKLKVEDIVNVIEYILKVENSYHIPSIDLTLPRKINHICMN